MKTTYWIGLFAMLPLTLVAEPEKVNFKMTMLDYKTDPITKHRCKYQDILKFIESRDGTRKAELELTKETAENPETHELCRNVFTNLTRLAEASVRDEIAAIIAEMPCEPGRGLVVEFGADINPRASEENPDIPHDYIVNKINFEDCMDEMPPLCSYPSSFTSWDSMSVIVDHEKMMVAFKDCRDALFKKVKEEGLREKWAKQKPQAKAPTPTEDEKP